MSTTLTSIQGSGESAASLNGRRQDGGSPYGRDGERTSPSRYSQRFIRTVISFAALALGEAALSPLRAEAPSATAGAYNDRVLAFIDTRPADASDRVPDNPGGWIETRPCDDDAGLATIDTVKPVGFTLNIR